MLPLRIPVHTAHGDFSGGDGGFCPVGVGNEKGRLFVDAVGVGVGHVVAPDELDVLSDGDALGGKFPQPGVFFGEQGLLQFAKRPDEGGGEAGAVGLLAGKGLQTGRHGADLRRQVDAGAVDADANDGVVDLARFGLDADLGEDAAELFPAEHKIVRPFDIGIHAADREDRPCGGDRGHGREVHEGFRLCVRAQDHAEIQTARRGNEGTAPAALSCGLAAGQNDGAVRRTLGGKALAGVVRGIHAGHGCHQRLPRMAGQVSTHKGRIEPVWNGCERIAALRRGVDPIALLPQLVDGLPDGGTGHAEGLAAVSYTHLAKISKLFGEFGSNVWFEKDADELVPEGFACPHCGGRHFEKETDTLDGWFDSGSTHFASMQKDQGFWPATVYLEGLDQYRGWFQSSLLTAVGALGKGAPFKECVTHGWTVDGEGKAMHKSLGNGVDPADVFKKYGADICRLWAGSADYHVDVRCSDEIFKQLSQNYLKFRNTAKFCLDNLTDFDPNQLTAPADMEALDRWAITKLNELLVKCEAAYQNYEFLTVSHAVNDFCVVTLSSLYLDIIKDRLYCDGADSAARRSAQSALWIILDAMTKVFAPILAFTCDEIWLQMPHRDGDDGRNVLLNQMSKPYTDYALLDTEMAVWETALRVRSDVNGVLETARADKRIGKSLEAHVALFATDEDAKAALDTIKTVDLPEIFIVSNVSTNEAAPAEGAVVGQGVNYPGLTVAVTEAKGTKCPRCWMHSESADEHGLCPRCAAVCKSLGVVFE